MALFALAALLPLALFGAGVVWGGWWSVAGLLYMTALAAGLDQITGLFLGDAPEGAEFPAADALLVALALGALGLMPLAVWAVAGDSGLSVSARAAVFAGSGLWLGQVANPAAHELIHRNGRGLFRLGGLVYCWLLFGHHTSAHRLVHHQHAASVDDPNTARAGEGYYAFLIRAWRGSFKRGWAAEDALRRRGKTGVHPYAVYIGMAALCLCLGYAIAGIGGSLAWAALAAHAQSQLMLSDYVQHYGLQREMRADGRLEPVSARHSWNAGHWFSAAFMLNAPRHSDHHAHPARPYPALRLPDQDAAPRLPWPLPLACLIALVPPLWKRAIRPHLNQWRARAAGA
ncbi:alkane 1-monooxygenase [Cypionkella aquatica]|uniref:Alkane 1-monooxygenase n=1 Tax=Cypionkella aquatica TaxID=1756042 RepID=A0AA37U5S4_9RHOB|nr:alkane 1-monooxygenase [Cypionkella aquatica]GLS88876.1 alkane 1-monooxygenase [Cypionkella aquatica]